MVFFALRISGIFYDHLLDESITVDLGFASINISFTNGHFKWTYTQGDVIKPNEPFTSHVVTTNYSEVMEIYQHPAELEHFKFYRFKHLEKFQNTASDSLAPPFGDNLLAVIMTNRHCRKVVKEIFGKFGYRINLRPEEGKIDIVKEYEDVLVSFPYSLSSETLQRMVFYLTAMQSNGNSVVTFEEPEAHAFPFYTKYLAERIALDQCNNQYFIATHNPYLITSIVEKAPKKDVAVFITCSEHYQTKVAPLSEKMKTKMLELGVDLFFNLDNLLKNQEESASETQQKD